MTGTLKEWLDRAEGDFRAATREVQAQDLYSYPVIAVLSQQCIEKLLKAFLISKQVDFPKIHDLQKLSELVYQVDSTLDLREKNLDWLTLLGGTSRYPEGDVLQEEALEAYELCQALRQMILPYFSEL
jgi:HEPN domain-containing protein